MAIKMCSIAVFATTDNEFCDLSLMKLGNKLKKKEKNAKISNIIIFFRKKNHSQRHERHYLQNEIIN